MATMKLGSKAEAFYLEGQTWKCVTELVSDVVVEVGEMSFHLHKFPLLNKSGLLQKMISEFHSGEEKSCILQLHEVPGGAKSFELVTKFCYDVKIELNALNVVCLRCAAEYLRMTEDYAEGNLIAQTENFLNEVFGNWKDSIKALETCEDVLPYAEELHIISRCINSLASKACADPGLFGWPVGGKSTSVLWNGIGNNSGDGHKSAGGVDWWYEDISFLSLPLFKRLIQAMEAKAMKPENIAGALMFYARRFLPGLTRNSSFRDGTTARINPTTPVSAPSESDQRVFLEEIVGLLPAKKGVASTKFLLGMLRTAMILHANPLCRENLEKRIGAQLDDASLEDLLIPNLGYSVETLYDIDCMQRIVDHFMMGEQLQTAGGVASPGIVEEEGGPLPLMDPTPSLTPMTMVAKLMDGYLAEVAPDVNLKLPKFQSLAAVIPDYARPLDDGIYRAIDIYLKSHPWLTESEREQLCRLMNCQKLSLEACTHAAQNERLPLRVVVQVLFFEQLRLRTSIASWFFVSDSMDNSHGPHTNLMLHKNNVDGAIQAEITHEQQHKDDSCPPVGVEDMRLRVSELEKECSSMKQEINKLGKTKSSWNIFTRKCGFGVKAQDTVSGK
ncbi:BTB/POZ domain-containing protein At5g03250-like isoform X1 [Ananas comosus]|uniref:BTB/POZ domain-containing protein At5g03250-like isoform X1 n=2 Tax=Ananas comosus TaxID=4615 RepID=A0A6P5G5X9_ANACO|nr:BTB/POZ domain-containing protein At5g03250-like isoform X1 [Ananas comosus]